MKQLALPYLRTAKLIKLRRDARRQCASPHPESDRLPVRFVVGCGRSGTTILGKVLGANPSVYYMREPYHLWHAVDPRTDVTGLHSQPEGNRFFMDAGDLEAGVLDRYDRLIARSGRAAEHCCVIEKTPHNAGKLGWIQAIEPNARVLHIVRNGLSVVRSIDRLATKPTYKLAFRPGYNQWWGERNAKWTALSTEGPARGYFADEVGLLTDNDQRGAYEWLVSIGEIDRQREALGERLIEITYTQLTADPTATCRLIADHFEIPCTSEWTDEACEMLSAERKNSGHPLRLPPAMCAQFNTYQERYGFEGRAIELDNDA
ncbi:MAG: sulfotransferase family protein [Phycisphaerales bacterium JB052]